MLMLERARQKGRCHGYLKALNFCDPSDGQGKPMCRLDQVQYIGHLAISV